MHRYSNAARVPFARLDKRLMRTHQVQEELVQRLGQLEVPQASLHRGLPGLNDRVAHISVRLDTVAVRLDRIEWRGVDGHG